MESLIPAVGLAPPSFHLSWSLWVQLPLFVAVLLLTFRAAWDVLGQVPWSRAGLVLALGAPLVVGWMLPQRAYHFAGHEGAYGELLDGALPESGDLTGHRTLSVPAGLAWALGKIAPERPARSVWLALNRLALGLVLLCMGAAAGLLSRARAPDAALREHRLAALLGTLFGLGCTPLLAWSATAFFIVPALALGSVALVLGLGRHPVAALAWGSLALGSRMETAPLLLAAVLVAGAASWRTAARGRAGFGLAGALGVFAWQAFTLSQKRSELPVEDLGPDPSVLWENLGNVALGGAWLGAGSLALCLCVLALAPRSDSWGRLGLAWIGCLVIALLQPVFLVDVGARHFLAAHALLLPPVAVSAAAWLVAPLRGLGGLPRWIVGIFVVGLGLAVGLQAFEASRALAHRYMSGHDAVLPEWAAAADAGRTGSAAELLDDRCYVVVPGGRSAWRGSRDSIDVREIHRAALALGAGWCVQWMVSGDAEFSGDTRAERLDRAVHTLGLRPTGWLDPPPGGGSPWLVLEAP